MTTKESIEEKKNELINLLNDRSIFSIQFTAETNENYYEIQFRRNSYSIDALFGVYVIAVDQYHQFDYNIIVKFGDNKFTITDDTLIDAIIKPAKFIDIKYIRKGDEELSYRKSIINSMLDNKNKEIEIYINHNGDSIKVFKINDNCWKAQWQNKIINVLPWVVAQDIMNFFNDVRMSVR